MTPPIAMILAGAWLILSAGYVALWFRYAALRDEAAELFAAGAIDADQAASLRGDIARRRAVTRLLATEVRVLRGALALAVDELRAARTGEVLLGEALDEMIREIGE